MIYIFNKNKIISYIITSTLVLMLFAFSTTILPSEDVKVQKVSANISNTINEIRRLKLNF